jgi:hypothetical protein
MRRSIMDDFKKVPESVEELEEILEEEFKEEEPSNENEVATEGEFDDEDSTDELKTEETEEVEEDDVKAKPSKKESKADYAFKKLRQEARELKKKSASYENFINELDTMARVYAIKILKKCLRLCVKSN